MSHRGEIAQSARRSARLSACFRTKSPWGKKKKKEEKGALGHARATARVTVTPTPLPTTTNPPFGGPKAEMNITHLHEAPGENGHFGQTDEHQKIVISMSFFGGRQEKGVVVLHSFVSLFGSPPYKKASFRLRHLFFLFFSQPHAMSRKPAVWQYSR